MKDRRIITLFSIFILSIVLLTPRLYSGDEIQYFAYLRSVWKDADLHFQNEYQWLYNRAPAKQENFKKAFIDRLNTTGYARNDAPIGCAILWAPFFAAADLFVKVTGSYPADGFSFPYIFAICFASAFYGFAGFLLQYQIARKYFGNRDSFWAVVTLWFGAHAVFYMYVTPPMSHATSIFTTSLFLFYWLRIRERNSVSLLAFARSHWRIGGARSLAGRLVLADTFARSERIPGESSRACGSHSFILAPTLCLEHSEWRTQSILNRQFKRKILLVRQILPPRSFLYVSRAFHLDPDRCAVLNRLVLLDESQSYFLASGAGRLVSALFHYVFGYLARWRRIWSPLCYELHSRVHSRTGGFVPSMDPEIAGACGFSLFYHLESFYGRAGFDRNDSKGRPLPAIQNAEESICGSAWENRRCRIAIPLQSIFLLRGES